MEKKVIGFLDSWLESEGFKNYYEYKKRLSKNIDNNTLKLLFSELESFAKYYYKQKSIWEVQLEKRKNSNQCIQCNRFWIPRKYFNSNLCPDCIAKGRGSKSKKVASKPKRVECSKKHTDFYIWEFYNRFEVYCLDCEEKVILPKQEKVK